MIHPSLYLAVAAGVAGYAAARRVALLRHQTDVTRKLATEHWDDVKTLVLVTGLVTYLSGTPPSYILPAAIPVAAGVYAWVSDLPALRSNLTDAGVGLKVALGIVVCGVVGSLGFLGYTQQQALAPLGLVAGLVAAYVASDYLAYRLADRQDVFHVHHWAQGLLLAALCAPFAGPIRDALVGTGLGIVAHAFAVYRPTSTFCSWRVPCRMTKYKDVPVVDFEF